ncbi:MAG: hypothetical protein GX608_07335 [Lentisphaerae bacterium]|nr:hypothetical protein [Lentisphaerota bacterium]
MKKWIIIDGYNFLGRVHSGLAVQGRSMEQSRRDLVSRLDSLVGELASRITVVFDGAGDGGAGDEPSAVDVRYSPANKSADALIHQMLLAAESPDAAVVVSSDRVVRDAAAAAGAESMGVAVFRDLMMESIAGLRGRADRRVEARFKPRLGDFFPRE